MTELTLANNKMKFDHFGGLARNRALQKLNLSSCSLDIEDTLALMEALKINQSLTDLNVTVIRCQIIGFSYFLTVKQKCFLDFPHMHAIQEALMANVGLKILDFTVGLHILTLLRILTNLCLCPA